mmetsp:Transcript_307/g.492  ORF Transcript_307/g.492 Transcript_307/m.492 type:complete len:125 (+) Transcript_307:137-511(+)
MQNSTTHNKTVRYIIDQIEDLQVQEYKIKNRLAHLQTELITAKVRALEESLETKEGYNFIPGDFICSYNKVYHSGIFRGFNKDRSKVLIDSRTRPYQTKALQNVYKCSHKCHFSTDLCPQHGCR